jgi:Tol biopolymer transport system component
VEPSDPHTGFWPRVTALVHGALAIPEPERRVWIEARADGNPTLLAEVVRLVNAHGAAGAFLEDPLVERLDMPALSAAQRLGPFTLRERIGAGGMGEVWRADDPSLGRQVAIKVLPPAFSRDPERLRRFEQEARAAGQISHPNILTVHAVGSDTGRPYLVTELLEGMTLRDRLDGGPLPVRKALDAAIQIAQGLAAAHERGIVHRDLKPANLFVTEDGRVKILDFGLAKLIEPAGGSDGLSGASGAIRGTVGYMAPEQIRGQPVDHRADLFAFGAVLYEMLAGRRAFLADSPIEVMTQILAEDPPPISGLDARLTRIVGRCLEKGLGERFQSAGDLAFHLEAIRATDDGAAPGRGARGVHARPWLPWSIAAAAAVLVAALLPFVRPRPEAKAEGATGPPRRFSLSLGATPLHVAEWPAIAVSANGTRMAFAANSASGVQIHVRDFATGLERLIDGTEDGFAPFFSPDGEHLGFFKGRDMLRVALAGGPPVRIAETSPVSRGAVWASDGRIYLSHTQSMAISRIDAAGGTLERVTELDVASGDQGHLWPDVAPDGSLLVYVSRRGTGVEDARIVARSLRTGVQRTIVEGGTFPRVLADGHVVFARSDTLHVIDIDPVTLRPGGPPRPVLRGVQVDMLFGGAQYAVARDGTLVYAPGDARPAGRTLLWVTPTGVEKPAFPEERMFLYPVVSPDGTSVVVTTDGSNQDLWRFYVDRPVLARLTSHPSEDFGAVWSPDGRQLAFTSARDGKSPAVFVKPADRADDERQLADSGFASGWSAAGRGVLVTTERYDGKRPSLELMLAGLDGGRLSRLDVSRYDRYGATPSPDGRHLAFVSLETGRPEVFVARPDAAGARQASVGGGTSPVWARDGRQLFYRAGDDVVSVAIGADPVPSLAPPRRLFSGRFEEPARPDWPRNYDVAPDGRFLMIRQTYTPSPRELVAVVGWSGQSLIGSR